MVSNSTKGLAITGLWNAGDGARRRQPRAFSIARKLIEPGDPVDIHEVRRLREAKRRDGDEALPAPPERGQHLFGATSASVFSASSSVFGT